MSHKSSLRIAKVLSLIGPTTPTQMQVICHKKSRREVEGWIPVFVNSSDDDLYCDYSFYDPIVTLPLDHQAKLYSFALQLEDCVLDLTPTAKRDEPYIEMVGCRVAGMCVTVAGDVPLIVDPNSQAESVEVWVSGTPHTINPQDVFDISPGHILFTNGEFLARGVDGICTFINVSCGHGSELATSMYREELNTISIVLFEHHEFIDQALVMRKLSTPPIGRCVSVELSLPPIITDEGGLAMIQNIALWYGSRQLIIFAVTHSGKVCLIDRLGGVVWLSDIDKEGLLTESSKCKEVVNIGYSELYILFTDECEPRVFQLALSFCEGCLPGIDKLEGTMISDASGVKVKYDKPGLRATKSASG